MATARDDRVLAASIADFQDSLTSLDRAPVPAFFAETADYRASGPIVRGRQVVTETASGDFSNRAAASVVSTRWLHGNVALVDSVFDAGDQRGWFTELWQWQEGDGRYAVLSARSRFGTPGESYRALNELTPRTVTGDVTDEVGEGETGELQTRFRMFRTAFNSGDSQGVVSLFTKKADAIVAFSFIRGRAQILNGQTAMGAKTDRMTQAAEVSNPNPTAARSLAARSLGALFVGGQPKVIRFLSPTVAVVDGTAEIAGIPPAHGFAPTQLTGVYTNVWSKASGEWLCEGARPWF